MKLYILLYISAFFVHVSTSNKYFRNDYTYIEQFDAFYKLYKTQKTWPEAVLLCVNEGAKLLCPSSSEEANAVMNLTQFKYSDLWVGYHDLFVEGYFFSIDGDSIDDVYFKWRNGEPNNAGNKENCVSMIRNNEFNDADCSNKKNFICKRSAEGIGENPICETYDTAYNYSKELNRCYKFHTIPMKWTDALIRCRSEGAQLAMINSETEANLFVQLFAEHPESSITENFDKNLLHLSFHDLIIPQYHMTFEGQHLSDAGYNRWAPGQPDNHGKDEHCGSMFRDGKLNDINCKNRAMFICEKILSVDEVSINTTVKTV